MLFRSWDWTSIAERAGEECAAAIDGDALETAERLAGTSDVSLRTSA